MNSEDTVLPTVGKIRRLQTTSDIKNTSQTSATWRGKEAIKWPRQIKVTQLLLVNTLHLTLTTLILHCILDFDFKRSQVSRKTAHDLINFYTIYGATPHS